MFCIEIYWQEDSKTHWQCPIHFDIVVAFLLSLIQYIYKYVSYWSSSKDIKILEIPEKVKNISKNHANIWNNSKW